jgi:hypothetical protein
VRAKTGCKLELEGLFGVTSVSTLAGGLKVSKSLDPTVNPVREG